MKTALAQFRSFPGPVRLLMVQQFTINAAFYMLMPYLATHLAHGLGLAAWAVGLVLGVRNLSQQGLFLIGGTLADRLGYKRVMMAGCLLRTAGFVLLGVATDLPVLIIASAATGFAGALFNPAVRAYLAASAGPERRVEAFALFNAFYQAGMLIGPLIGLALLAFDFRLVCAVAALLFLALTLLQARALPEHRATAPGNSNGVLADWRSVIANRPFLLFAAAMTGSYVLSFQVYLALPLAAEQTVPGHGNDVTTALFAVSALVAVTAQVRLTRWARARWSTARAICYGLALMAAAFLPPLTGSHVVTSADPLRHWVEALTPLLATAALIALATALLYPFEMDTVVALSGNRLVATHYGLYNTITGIGITLGNLATGAVWDTARTAGHPRLPWLALAVTGAACTGALALLARSGKLTPSPRPAKEPELVA
ncbi:MFS family permease [Streptacidiphilus sp. MAP12-20]|uniref:MFS transporter n=1 Tax=Streptacidiphilus sp. MAP12-20 TaxID=3156299 RepID=UPI0035199364